MTNYEKLNEVFGNFMSEMNNMDDLRKWLGSEYMEKSKSVRRREDIQFDEDKDGQMSFLKNKDLYHFEGWANWYAEDGYLQVGRFDMYTQAKSEAQALNNIKARIKKQHNWPMNKRVDIDLNDGVSTLTKDIPPISQYKVIYPNDYGIEILVKARNIQGVCDKLDECGILWKENDVEIRLGNIAE